MLKRINKDKFFIVLPYVVMIVSFLCTFTFIYFKGRNYVDSDMASEMMLANLLNKEGSIFSKSWYYSSELRVFYLQWIYRLTILIFPNNWFLARVIGQALWMIVLVLSYFFVCNKKGLNLKNNGALGATCLMNPFGIWYFWYVQYGGAYIPHMVLLLISLGLFIRVYKNENKYKTIYLILLAIVCLINGLGGIKGHMALYVPLCVATFLVCLIKYMQNKQFKKECRLFLLSLYPLAFALIGYLINIKVLSNIYAFASDHNRIYSTFDISNFVHFISSFLSLFGWPVTDYWYSNVGLLSITGILGAFSIITITIVIWSIISLIKNYNKLDLDSKLITILFLCSFLIQCFIFALTSGPDSPNQSYFLTFLPLTFIVIEIAIKNSEFEFPYSKEIIALLLTISTCATSVSSVKIYFNTPLHNSSNLRPVYEFLSENGYSQGYASFWNSNVITEWSNGNIEMWTVRLEYDNFLSLHEFLQLKNHHDNPKEEVFILTSKDELENAYMYLLVDHCDVVYQDDNGYMVLVFKDYQELQKAIEIVK